MFRRAVITGLFFLYYFSALPAMADQFDMKDFSKIPVMHEGRIKPMDSFARSLRKRLSGRDTDAMLWLTEALLNPALAENTPALKIINPDLLNMLELERRKNKLFTYKEVSKSLEEKQDILRAIIATPEENWTSAQHDFVMLQENAVLLGDILSSMTLFLPLSIQLPDDVPASLKPYANKTLSYIDILIFYKDLQDQVLKIIKEKGENIEGYTTAQQAITYISFTFSNLENAGKRSKVFTIIPSPNIKQWTTPWSFVLKNEGTPELPVLLRHWKDLSLAFHGNDKAAWKTKTQEIRNETYLQSGEAIRIKAVEIEYYYNLINPFYISMLLYASSLFALIIGSYWKKGWLTSVASLPLWTGAVFHSSGIAARIYILERPPVSTLYESIIFAGLIAVLYGLIAFSREKVEFWLFISASSGFMLHMLGFSHDSDGDNLMMLSAVLNTNFWLATHVICITMGYAFCLITSILAHFALIASAIGKYKDELFKHIHNVALLALLFSTVGTVLGGIWADQSWGRFWGWDPKENGALLIVLWLIWTLHGRISGQMQKPMVIAGLAFLSVIVALSWFGVNLLSVGLHAYGFTDSAALSLGIFIGVETALIGALLWRTHGNSELA